MRSPRHHIPCALVLVAAVALAPAAAEAARQQPAVVSPAAPPAAADSVAARMDRVRKAVLANPAHMQDQIPELTQILALDPNLAEAHMLLGVAYRSAGGPMMGEAKAELQQALAIEPGLIAARLILAQLYMDLGRYDNARDEANVGLVEVPGQPQFLSVLGESERHLGDPERALQLNRLALEADPSLTEAHFYLALAMLDLGQRDDAIRELEGLAKAGVSVADVYLRLGMAYLDANQLDSAIGSFTLGARVAPTNREMRIKLARAYRLKGSLAQADQQLAGAAAPPSNVQASADLERVDAEFTLEVGLLRLRQNRLAAAADALAKAATMDPKGGESHRGLAEVYLRQGAVARARDEATQADALGAPLPADLRQRLGLPAAAAPKGP